MTSEETRHKPTQAFSSTARAESCVSLLRRRLEAIEAKMLELLDCSTVSTWRDDPYSGVVFIGPKRHWGEPANPTTSSGACRSS